jgi:hypothetical protein
MRIAYAMRIAPKLADSQAQKNKPATAWQNPELIARCGMLLAEMEVIL